MEKEVFCKEISVKKYKDYLNIKKDIYDLGEEEDIDIIYKLVSIFTDYELENLEVYDVANILEEIEFYIQAKIESRIYDIASIEVTSNEEEILTNDDADEDKLDEITRLLEEEDRQAELEIENNKNIYEHYLYFLNGLIKYAIKMCRCSLKDVLDMDIIDLLDYIKFDLEDEEKHK